ncbi:uncharacterized protein DS421_14g478890 [Arachis hypogaea]|nr:uncharacterized protein DS421_14g478890 [Arachis hypogaea]
MVFLNLPLSFAPCPSSISSTLMTEYSIGLLLTCSNHLRRDSTIFFTMGVTPTLSLCYTCGT